MRFINFNSISTKIIILLITTSTIFIAFTFNMAKNIFSEGFEKIIHEKMIITQNSLIPQISLNLSYEFYTAIEDIGNHLLKNQDILFLKINSPKLNVPYIFSNSVDTEVQTTEFVTHQFLLDPTTKEKIGEITLMYSNKSYNEYMGDFYTWIGWGILAFLLSILFISIFLLKALKPLSILVKSMDDFNPFEPKKFDSKSYKNDEIGSIASATNVMIENLTQYIQQSNELTLKLSTKEMHLRDAQRIANVGSWEYNVIDDSLVLSDEVYRILGLKSSNKLNFSEFLAFITDDDRSRVKSIINNAIEKGAKFNIHYKLIVNSGKTLYIRTRGKVRKKASGSVKLTAVSIDITKEVKSKETIEKLAYYDSLTGLPNRSLLKDRANTTLIKASRDNSKFAILFLDLDHFKLINDTLGHAIGDQLLIYIASKLKGVLREADTISRIGGDEFIILLSEIKSVEDAEMISKKILNTLNAEHTIKSNKLHITTSIGIAIYPESGENLDELMTNADTAMYEAKKHGRNTYTLYSKEMSDHISKIIMVEQDLRASIKNPEEFEVFYQPKIDSSSGHISGAEALVRWRHPTQGLIFPDNFIHIAESSGTIIDIGNIIIQRVIQDIDQFNRNGITDLKVAINLSPKQFGDKFLISNISSLIREYRVDATQLEFEITESLSMQNIEETLKILHQIKDLGSSIAIDDFGTGYSSLSYLKQFPINTLKIDKSFVLDMTNDNDDKAIVRTIISMAQALDFKTVAEGVETKDHVTLLALMGCSELQGYYYSKAVVKNEFIEYLKQSKSN